MSPALTVTAFLTFSTYGERLHGDERGSLNRKGTTLKSRFVAPNLKLEQIRRVQMDQPPMLFDAAMRGCTHRAIESHCQFKAWKLLGLNVRTNHVHALIQGNVAPKKMLQSIKAAVTRALREAGLATAQRKIWTEGGGATTCDTERDVMNVRHYIKKRQGADLPME